MAKVDFRLLEEKDRQALRKEISATFGRLGLKSEGQEFLLDLLTPSEVVMLARRIQIAKRLLEGDAFEEIATELHVGVRTVHAVDSWLGVRFASYRSVLPEIARKAKKLKQSGGRTEPHPAVFDPTSFRSLRRRYPTHFLLLNVLLGDPWKG